MKSIFISLLVCSINVCFASPTVLKAIETTLDVNHKKATVFDIIQENGSEGYAGVKGQLFDVILKNETHKSISIHWHGLILPNNQDGIPYVTQLPIPPHHSQHYQFKLIQSGTYWMHSHYKFHEQELMAAPLIIHDPQDPYKSYKDVVITLQDFSFTNPATILANLHNRSMNHAMQNMVMEPVMKQDLNDVQYDAFLANRHTLLDPQVMKVIPGEKLRLRIINASSATNYWINTGKLTGVLIATDGEAIHPVKNTLFQLAIAQRLDILVTIPKKEGTYPILAQVEGTKKQSGIVLVTPQAKFSSIPLLANQSVPALNDDQDKQLHALSPLPDKPVTKSLTYTLNGDMKEYVWSINKEFWPYIKPLKINQGDRVEMIFINNTAMSHPMHLHGHVFQISEINGKPLSAGSLHDTILVLPHTTKKIIFDATNPGIWMMHCHVLYHMLAGMMTTTNYQDYPEPSYYQALLKGKIKDY